MDETRAPSAKDDGQDQPKQSAGNGGLSVVSLAVGGLYLSTHSVVVTAIGAALMALLSLAGILVGCRQR
jgi:hypothetical protein